MRLVDLFPWTDQEEFETEGNIVIVIGDRQIEEVKCKRVECKG